MKTKLIISIALNITLLSVLSFYAYRSIKFRIEFSKRAEKDALTNSYKYTDNISYNIRKSQFDILPKKEKAIIFVGTSLTHNCEWSELLGTPILNRGISADISAGILARINQVTALKPEKIFLEIGTNDLYFSVPMDTTMANYNKILDSIKINSPSTKVYIEGVLPKSSIYSNFKQVPILNQRIKQLAMSRGYKYIDLYSIFVDKNGTMPAKYSSDGVHVFGNGYLLWKSAIQNDVFSN